ncbi:hypothetical protein KC345_g11775 [Hortaea werneckii]|nr:hypothetical protein KC345_g11775 [Hortaea werneckii]
MNNILSGIQWKDQSAECEVLLKSAAEAGITPLKGGLEAEVYQISLPDAELVYKIWNRESRPDVSLQYKVLEQMHRQGLAVSRPYGWGIDPEQNQVLLTSYDGLPVKKVNTPSLKAIAGALL